jgi:hypothetical protein
MLFRNTKGELVEINKYDSINDKLYYQKIMEIKKMEIHSQSSKLEKIFSGKKQ